jgi:hypothetical protein
MNAAMPELRPATEQISGVIERVTFHKDDSGICVLRIKTKGHREETTVVGSLPSVTAREWLVAEGCWVTDRKHGLQFNPIMMKTLPPTLSVVLLFFYRARSKPDRIKFDQIDSHCQLTPLPESLLGRSYLA